MRTREYATETETIGETVLRFLEEQLTEARTDAWIAAVLALPMPRWIPRFIPNFVIGRVLDWIFPDKLLALLRFFLRRVGAIPPAPTERQAHPDNPFRQE